MGNGKRKKGKQAAQEAPSVTAVPEVEPFDPNAPPPEQLDRFDNGGPKQGRLL